VELRFLVRGGSQSNVKSISLEKSEDYVILDSLSFVNEQYYRTRIRFKDLANTEFPALKINVVRNNSRQILIPLLPFSDAYATLNITEGDLYIGEEKRFEILSNNLANLKIDQRWQKNEKYEFRYLTQDDKVFLVILPLASGKVDLHFTPEFKKPNYKEGELHFKGETQSFELQVRGSRLSFVLFDVLEIVWNPGQREGVEVQLDSHRDLLLNRTYRIEATD
jgi:hypothetical protein